MSESGTTTQPFEQPFEMEGRVALIIGAGSDMGAAMARVFAEAGAEIVLADIAEGPMDRTSEALQSGGRRALSRRVDVRQKEEVDELVLRAKEHFGRLDAVLNIAGVIHDAAVSDTAEADLDRVLDVNLKGVYFGCQAAVKAMGKQGHGSIINMASLAAFSPVPLLSAYAMSKAAVVALTRTLALEVGRFGLRVNAIAPGYVEGGMTVRHLRDESGHVDAQALEALQTRQRKRTPLGITGTPEDIAHLALFLASDASRYMTGQVLHANGGSYMP